MRMTWKEDPIPYDDDDPFKMGGEIREEQEEARDRKLQAEYDANLTMKVRRGYYPLWALLLVIILSAAVGGSIGYMLAARPQ
jgi:hypothetical protein